MLFLDDGADPEKHKDTSTERSQMSSCDGKNWEVNGKMTVKYDFWFIQARS